MEEFQFHMTLSGALDSPVLERAETALRARLGVVPAPLVIGAICLMGEGHDGRFYMLERFGLEGMAQPIKGGID